MKRLIALVSSKRAFGLLAITLLAVGACGSGSRGAAKPGSVSTPAPSVAASASSVSTSTSLSDGPSYSTRFFGVPFDLALPSFLDPTPSDEGANFVTWGSADGSVAVRFLRPVVVFPPGSTDSGPVPADYVAYLLGQAGYGAHIADREDTTIDGHKATIVTGTTDQPLDGSLGCPGTGIAADECFGLQPEFALRIAVVATDSGPLLIWLRSAADAAADVAAEHQRLAQLLSGLHFADRAVDAAQTTAADTNFDGVYTWTITKQDALAHSSDQTPEDLALYPNTFTATLQNGHFHLSETSTNDVQNTTFAASPGRLQIGLPPDGLSIDVTRDPDGTLHLNAIAPIVDAGGAFILTTRPWVPVAGDGQIPFGTYERTITARDAEAVGIGADDVAGIFRDMDHITVSIVIAPKRWTLNETDTPGEPGDLGTYSFDSSGRWVTVSESSGCTRCVLTYDWHLAGDDLVLALADVPGDSPHDAGVRLMSEGTFARSTG